MMFSVDYPFSPTTHGRDYLDLLAPTLTDSEMQAFTHTNAEKLLKLK